eukprot:TRINITY_DN23288_c0_g1_i4.p1 TRINITY_DN23288_c0_g1~~TRINITY_DN23288_c0_g1_i4.p1  ORF type:complete len:147 (-),score=17.27 TRINITY_DN23288_c0_g1_i4:60-500(-)
MSLKKKPIILAEENTKFMNYIKLIKNSQSRNSRLYKKHLTEIFETQPSNRPKLAHLSKSPHRLLLGMDFAISKSFDGVSNVSTSTKRGHVLPPLRRKSKIGKDTNTAYEKVLERFGTAFRAQRARAQTINEKKTCRVPMYLSLIHI